MVLMCCCRLIFVDEQPKTTRCGSVLDVRKCSFWRFSNEKHTRSAITYQPPDGYGTSDNSLARLLVAFLSAYFGTAIV